MSDEEEEVSGGEEEEASAEEKSPAASPKRASPAKQSSPAKTGPDVPELPPIKHEVMEYKGTKHAETRAKIPHFSAGKPSKFEKEKLMSSEGIIRIQSGTNKFSTQAGMTGFGVPRDVVDKIFSPNLQEIVDEEKIKGMKSVLRLQSGSNKYASQKGTRSFGTNRDVLCRMKGTGGASEVPEDKARATDGIVPLQSGTNKLASQAGMTGFGMPRWTNPKENPTQDTQSQGFIHLQMGTNRFASQSGMTGFGMPRHNISKYKDEVRGEMPNDESIISRQTTGWKDGANQNGMSGFGAFRNTTNISMANQDRASQGLIPYQMGINWGDSQAGKTGFGMPRMVYTEFTDDTRAELPGELARDPATPFWSGMERDFANQSGMTAMGMPRDVSGQYLRRLW